MVDLPAAGVPQITVTFEEKRASAQVAAVVSAVEDTVKLLVVISHRKQTLHLHSACQGDKFTFMDASVVSSNLRRLRVAAGKSQAAAADAAGLSRVGYRNIESGQAEPRVATLQRIAIALGVRLEDLLTPSRQLRAVRFRAQKRMTSREELMARVGGWLDDYAELERLVGDQQKFQFAKVRKQLPALRGPDRARAAAELARRAVGLKNDELIRDICGLLEDNGVKVLTPKIASEGFFGLSVADDDVGPAVVVNTWERVSVERWIFTAAHELGHLLLHLDAFDATQTEEDKAEESEADIFAGHFLMPDEVFDREFDEAKGLPLVSCVFKLKRIFRVSYRTVLYRISTKLAPEEGQNIWRTFQRAYAAHAGVTLKRTDEPDRLAPDAFFGRPPDRGADEPEKLLAYDFVEDRLYRLVRHALETDAITLHRGAKILDKSLTEMREITASWVG